MKNLESIDRLTTLESALNKAQFKLAQPLTNRAFYLDFLIAESSLGLDFFHCLRIKSPSQK